MHHIAIYGAGHLTKSLLKGLSLYTKQHINIFNRTFEKVLPLKQYYKYINPVSDINSFVESKSFVFIIISPAGILNPEEAFKKQLRDTNSILVSCGYFNTIDMLNKAYPDTKIIRLSPNINWQIAHGVTIYTHNEMVDESEMNEFIKFISPITTMVKAKKEDDFDNLGKITSCGPALYMNIIENLCDSFGIKDPVYRDAVYRTISGVFEYASQTGISPTEIISEVANKGGITESGITAINNYLPPAFADVKDKMVTRTEMVKKNLMM